MCEPKDNLFLYSENSVTCENIFEKGFKKQNLAWINVFTLTI